MGFTEKFYRKVGLSSEAALEQPLFQRPKLYFSVKFTLLAGILLQRFLLMHQEDLQGFILFAEIQLIGLPVFFFLELGLFWLTLRSQKLLCMSGLSFSAFQIVELEFIIMFSMPISHLLSSNSFSYIIQQEIILICLHIIVFMNSIITKAGLLLYTSLTLMFRLAPSLPQFYYAGWSFMVFSIIAGYFVFLFSREKAHAPQQPKTEDDFSKYDGLPHPFAISTKSKEVLFMNSLFKGVLNSYDDKDALQKVAKMTRFEDFNEQTKRLLLQEINVKTGLDTKTRNKPEEDAMKKRGSGSQPANNHPRKNSKKKSTILIKKPEPNINLNVTRNEDGSPGAGFNSSAYGEKGKLLKELNESKNMSSQRNLNDVSDIPSAVIEHEAAPNTVGFYMNKLLSSSSLCITSPSNNNRNKVSLAQAVKSIVHTLFLQKGSQTSNRNSAYVEVFTTRTQKIEAIHRNSKGELSIIEVTLVPIINDQKTALFISLRDITWELKARDLQETSQHKDRLLRFVSHEFRTPLNCISMSLNMLKPLIAHELNKNYLLPAYNSSQMLLNLANDILDFSQIQARKLKVSIFACDLKNILNEVITMMEMQASVRKVSLELDWDSKIPKIYYTDGNRLKQILLNLISNALKFTLQGSITIKGTYICQNICRIEVIDTGVGISEQNLKNLFSEFGKIQDSNHLNPQGVGLGLVISMLLSQELGPDRTGLQVKSQEGVGTTFYFMLSSKYEFCENGENTDLGSSDDEQAGVQSLIPSRESNIRSLFNLKRNGRKNPKLLINAKEAKSEAETIDRKIKLPDSPYTFDFVHVYANSTPKMHTVYLKSPPVIAQTKSIFSIKTKRLLNEPDSKRKCLSAKTIPTMEDNQESDQAFESLKRLNMICKCPKILVVDDNAFNLNALKLMLKRFEIESVGVTDGELAIKEVLDNEGHKSSCKNFSLIFMDIEMPRLDGFETAKLLRSMMLNKEISYIPIIGITGHNPQEKRVECLLSGMNDMVSKPVTPQVIQDLINRWIE